MKKNLFFAVLSCCYFILVQCSTDKCSKNLSGIENAENLLKQNPANYVEALMIYNNCYFVSKNQNCNHHETINKSKKQFKELENLKKLNLKGKLIFLEDDFFRGLPNLQELDLSSSMAIHLQYELLKELTKLEKLNLSFNGIYELDTQFDGLVQLRELDLSSNELIHSAETQLNKELFKNLTKLQKLNLSFNHLYSLDKDQFNGLVNLQSLDLRHNHLNTLDKAQFSALGNLQELFLNANNLQFLDKESFVGINNLKTLDIGNNFIKELVGLNNLPALEVLNLQGCIELSQLPNEIAQLKKLRYIFVYGSSLSPTEIERVQKLIPWAKMVNEKDSHWNSKS